MGGRREIKEVGKRQSPWRQVASLLKNQSFKRNALHPMPYALSFRLPHSHFRIPTSEFQYLSSAFCLHSMLHTLCSLLLPAPSLPPRPVTPSPCCSAFRIPTSRRGVGPAPMGRRPTSFLCLPSSAFRHCCANQILSLNSLEFSIARIWISSICSNEGIQIRAIENSREFKIKIWLAQQ